ncbi:MAG: SDR family oxidoreductase [Planctomycetes bacterium]|nr:SDR family oxidoreductase [Planctomycetota bacterium]
MPRIGRILGELHRTESKAHLQTESGQLGNVKRVLSFRIVLSPWRRKALTSWSPTCWPATRPSRAFRRLAGAGSSSAPIAPGGVETDMTRGYEYPVESYPIARLGRPEDIAEAVVFLASQATNYITGAVLDVNGGIA